MSVVCGAGRLCGNLRVDVPVREFLGIPFADPPVGPLRFTRPQLLRQFPNETLDATQRRFVPYQSTGSVFPDDRDACWIPKESLSEDCLQLNIWTPSEIGNEQLPVLVWIYGGAFVSGSPTLSLYDGALLAFHGRVVVVSINYRLGPFGFLYAPEHDCRGNMGLWDQQCALLWIASNIKAFGGDPHNVTLFGESAGSASATAHLLCPSSWPLFHQVILQSGVLTNPWSLLPSHEAKVFSEELIEMAGGWEDLKKIDAGSLLDMYASTVDDLASVTYQPRFVPIIDGDFIPDDPLLLLRKGFFKKCPIMMGFNKDEGSVVSLSVQQTCGIDLDFQLFRSPVQHFLSTIKFLIPFLPRSPVKMSLLEENVILHEYFPWNSNETADIKRALVRLVGDFYFLSDIFHWMSAINNWTHDDSKIFAYHFKHSPSSKSWPAWSGCKHGDEVFFVFGEPLRETSGDYAANEKTLALSVIQIWASFAHSGCDANVDVMVNNGKLKWIPWTKKKKNFLVIDSDSIHLETINDHDRQENFWKSVIPQLRNSMNS